MSKASVMNEVAKTTNYTGARDEGEKDILDRVSTTDEDEDMLERFWSEACNTANDQLKPFLTTVSDITDAYEVALTLSSAYDDRLTNSVQASLFSFFVQAILSKWFAIAKKDEAASYGTAAASSMEDVMRKVYYKRRPTRRPVRKEENE